MKYSTVLFDLDGTLTDPEQGICKSVMYALQKAGNTVGNIEDYHKYIGPPLLPAFEAFDNATPEEARILLEYYRERFSSVGLFENIPYPGILELLRDLKLIGCKVAVATGKPTVFSEKIVAKFGFAPYIDYVSGTPLSEKSMDKCEVILTALNHLGVSANNQCVMIGDRSHDAIGAKMANIDFIGVLYGYGSYDELSSEGAAVLVKTVSELRNILLS